MGVAPDLTPTLFFIGGHCNRTKRYKQDIKKEKDLSKHTNFNDAQQGAMFDLNEDDKKIINFIKDFFDKNNYYPIPKQVLDSLNLESPKNRINYITRDKMKKLSSFLEFKDGDYRGKRISFTKKFLELK